MLCFQGQILLKDLQAGFRGKIPRNLALEETLDRRGREQKFKG